MHRRGRQQEEDEMGGGGGRRGRGEDRECIRGGGGVFMCALEHACASTIKQSYRAIDSRKESTGTVPTYTLQTKALSNKTLTEK